MTIAERITLIRAGYKIGEMEAKEAEPEAREEAQEQGTDPDPRDREIEQLKQRFYEGSLKK